jgi:uncharacterized membrane protein
MTDTPGQPAAWVRPLHPMFTHFPIAAYVLAAGFDIISVVGGPHRSWAGQLWHAGTYVLIGGLAICLVTMMTGFADLIRFGERRSPVVRIIAVHVCIMAAVFMIGVGDLALRLSDLHRASTPPAVLILTIAAAVGVCTGAFFGGTLVYKHGAGVMVAAPSADEPDGSDAARLRTAAANGSAANGSAANRAVANGSAADGAQPSRRRPTRIGARPISHRTRRDLDDTA